MTDHYQILGVPRKADKQAIRSAYKRLAFMYHPDKNPDNPVAEEKFKLINEAYQVLSDNEKKEIYDLQLTDTRRVLPSTSHSYEPFKRWDRETYRRNAFYKARYNAQQKYSRKYLIKIYTLSGLGLLAFWSVLLVLVFYWRHYLASEHFKRGISLFKEKNFYEALYAYNNALAEDERYAEVYFAKAEYYIVARQNYADALYNIEEGIKCQPKKLPAQVLMHRAICNYYLNNYSNAILDLDSLVKDTKWRGDAYFFRGAIHNNRHEQVNACADWLQAYKFQSDSSLDSLNTYCQKSP